MSFAGRVLSNRQPQESSHVHHIPFDEIGAQLFPCNLAIPTPQAFGMASTIDNPSRG